MDLKILKGTTMKKILFLLIILLASCQKEPLTIQPIGSDKPIFELGSEIVAIFNTDAIPAQTRNGEYWPLWYKESLTTDNYLLYPLPRKQEAYNKLMVDSVYMQRKGTLTVNIDGITHATYEVKIKFKNQPIGDGQLYLSVLNADEIKYAPFGSNVLHTTNQFKIVSLVRTNDKVQYMDWHLGKMKNKWKYNIYGDTTMIGSEYLFGSTPTGTAFLFPHK